MEKANFVQLFCYHFVSLHHLGISWTLLDESYLDSYSTSKARPEDWKAFLTELGVQHFLAIKRKQVKLHRDSMVSSQITTLT